MFAAPEIAQWATDVAKEPYNLNVNFTPSSSQQARFDFTQKTEDFGVTDIRYQPFPFDTTSPAAGTFIYLPVSAGGLAFMYNLPSVPHLQLSSYSACALFTGAVPFWDSPVIQADNPGIDLPHVKVEPVLDSDNSGTNYVFEEYCIEEQPALWAAFISAVTQYNLNIGDGDFLSPTIPSSVWPQFISGLFVSGANTQADAVAGTTSSGEVTAVEPAYAIQRHTPVASVKNASGLYVQPTDINVASALAYAVQQPDGTHVLNFNGIGPNVYNPSTYSYAIAPTAGFDPAKGAVLGAFLNFSLTLGQQQASGIGYSSLGLSLERQGVARATAIPGDPALTNAEQEGYSCGDLTPTDVAHGDTIPTCGAINPNTLPLGAPGSPGALGNSHAGGTSAGAGGATGSNVVAAGALGSTGASGADGLLPAAGLDPSVSLSSTVGPLGDTGIDAVEVSAVGVLLMALGVVLRRRRRRRT